MGSATNYWQLVHLDGIGQRRVREVAIAKSFFQQRFPDLVDQQDIPDRPIQTELWGLWRDAAQPQNTGHLAERCLRCFISQQIEQVCVQLETQFGTQHGFTRRDLFPLLLNDDGEPAPAPSTQNEWRSLASKILQTFDPSRAGLSTWVSIQTKHSQDLRAFLLEHGVYLISNWAILNDTSPKQLRRILSEFYNLTSGEVDRACCLLQAYHQSYRQDRIRDRATGNSSSKKSCQSPTPEQLNRITQFLGSTESNQSLLTKLQTLATQVRQYRIHKWTGRANSVPFDQPGIREPPVPMSDDEQNEFLHFYEEQFQTCLDLALQKVTSDRATHRRRKNQDTAFLVAMKLFHCQGQSMGAIAPQIGLQKQFQVTRLMKLKEFREDVRQRWLQILGDRIFQQYPESHPEKVKAALDELVTEEINQAEAEAAVAKNQAPKSLFARRFCRYLD